MHKHTVTFPDGTTAKRTSQNRIYPFMVALSPEPKLATIARVQRALDHEQRDLARFQGVIASGELPSEFTMLTIENYRGFVKTGTVQIQKLKVRLAELEAGPEFTTAWGAVTWCGRDDLAVKAQAKWAEIGRPDGREARIFQTEIN